MLYILFECFCVFKLPQYKFNYLQKNLIEHLKAFDIKLVNLQYGDVSHIISKIKSDYGVDIIEINGLDIFNDIDGLAALISACDYVISTTNLTPHLAGAMGIETKLLLPQIANEIWGLQTEDSYLYQTIKLYRQPINGDWTEPLMKLINDLRLLLK